jgi:hypothetical protein
VNDYVLGCGHSPRQVGLAFFVFSVALCLQFS